LPSWKEDLEEEPEAAAPPSAPASLNELRSLPSWKDELDEAGEAERPSAPPAFTDPFGFDDDEVTGEFTPSGRPGVPTAPTDPEDMARLLNSVPEPPPEDEPESEPVSAVQAVREEAATAEEQPAVHDIALDQVRGFQDLPLEAQLLLARTAVLHTLRADEELSDFAAALVTRGSVGIMPTISDISAKIARAGEVVFTEGSLADGLLLRVVALLDETTVAVWDRESLEEAMADCPWVSEELRSLADRLQALSGATLGPLGDRLDDSLRTAVTDRLEVRVVESHEALVEAGRPVPGLFIVGAGRIEVLDGDEVSDELGPGDILFASEVMTAGAAPATARAGKGGAVVLHAKRAVAHELMLVVPPLLEVLSGF
jgi:CRP-like cAMP-binding protein